MEQIQSIAEQTGSGLPRDCDIRQAIYDRLAGIEGLQSDGITVTVDGGAVRLEGAVLDEQSKLRAEDAASAIFGVESVDNRLRLKPALLRYTIYPYMPIVTEDGEEIGWVADHYHDDSCLMFFSPGDTVHVPFYVIDATTDHGIVIGRDICPDSEGI